MSQKSTDTTALEAARATALEAMAHYQPEDPEYKTILKRIETLSKLIEAENPPREKLNVNSVMTALSGLAGIVTIVAYEQKHVFGSQAAKFIGKLR